MNFTDGPSYNVCRSILFGPTSDLCTVVHIKILTPLSFLLTILYKYFLSYFQVRHCEHYIIHDIGIGNWNWSWNRNQNRKEEYWKCSCEVQTNFMKKTLSKGTILTASTVSRFKNRLGCPRINILYICLISFHKQISNLS